MFGVAVSIAIFAATSIEAATSTWNGGGGNVNWSTAGNWTGGAPANAATTDVIFAGATNLGTAGSPLNQNIASFMLINSIAFSSGGGSFFLGGSSFDFEGASNTITQNSSSAESIANGFAVNFNNAPFTLTLAGSGSGLVTISGNIISNSGQRDYAIVKSGSSTFVLSGVNTYGGGTTIDGGTLCINSASSLGATSGGLIINAGTLEISTGFSTSRVYTLGNAASTIQVDPSQTLTVTSAIGGSGNLNKTGTGTLALSGSNAFTGVLTVAAGNLSIATINNASANGVLGNSANAVVLGSNTTTGTLQYTGATASSTKKFTMATGGTGSFQIDTAGTTLTLSGIIDGSGALFKSGAGILSLSGVNTYSGGTTVSAGTLQLSGSGTLGSTSGSLTVNGGTLDLNGTNQSVGALYGSGGTILNNNSTAKTLTVGTGGGTGSYAGVIADHSAGTGTVALIKTGAGSQTLTGTNTYTGATQVNGGKLLINGNDSAATGAVTVNNSGTVLAGTGTIGGAVTVNSGAIILGGAGAAASGTLTVANNVTLGSNSIIELALGGSGTHSTLARTGGTWSFQAAQQFTFIDLGAQSGVTYSGIITGLASNPGTEANWIINNAGWTGTFVYNSGNIDLTLTATPEPATYLPDYWLWARLVGRNAGAGGSGRNRAARTGVEPVHQP